MQLIGKILWWNERDGFGIIEDASGSEFYFDTSNLVGRSPKNVRRNQIVGFEINTSIDDCLAAARVKIPTASEKKRLENNFDKQLQLSLIA